MTGVQTCALPISPPPMPEAPEVPKVPPREQTTIADLKEPPALGAPAPEVKSGEPTPSETLKEPNKKHELGVSRVRPAEEAPVNPRVAAAEGYVKQVQDKLSALPPGESLQRDVTEGDLAEVKAYKDRIAYITDMGACLRGLVK